MRSLSTLAPALASAMIVAIPLFVGAQPARPPARLDAGVRDAGHRDAGLRDASTSDTRAASPTAGTPPSRVTAP
ncbi:MAG: hypothetical protein U0326_44345 [Polyangiales bacterium]